MNFTKIFFLWLPSAFVVGAASFFAYVFVQQDLRQSANDPQIQMAEDAASFLAANATPSFISSLPKVDMGQSLTPYLIVFNDSGKAVASSVFLHGSIPEPPPKVFEYVRNNKESRFTWQPEPGVRSAVVIEKLNGASSGFVLAGRSLREVERREDQILMLALAACVVSLAASFGVCVFAAKKLF